MTSRGYNWGIDIGGTTTVIGYIDSSGYTCLDTIGTEAGTDPKAHLERIRDLIRGVDDSPVSLGIGIAGFVRRDMGLLVFSPNLPGWETMDIRGKMADLLGCPVFLENDSNVFAIREVSRGIIPRDGIWLLVTLGTGIGGTIVSEGRILHGRDFAGEFGHMTVEAFGLQCPCGSRGCWERYSSAGSLVRYFSRNVSDPASATPREITSLADSGDTGALSAFSELGRWLGVGLVNLSMCFDPSGILLAGGLTVPHRHFLSHARDEFLRRCSRKWNVDVVELCSSGGSEGAAILGRDSIG